MARVSDDDKKRIIGIIKEGLEGIQNPPSNAIRKKKFVDSFNSTGISDILEGIAAWIFAEEGSDKQIVAWYLGNRINSREACEMFGVKPRVLEKRVNSVMEKTVDNLPHRTAMDLLTISLNRDYLTKRTTWRLKGCKNKKCGGDQYRQAGETIRDEDGRETRGPVWHCMCCGREDIVE